MTSEIEKTHLGGCPICWEPIYPDSFRNEISEREFRISGLCQKCQDSVFGED